MADARSSALLWAAAGRDQPVWPPRLVITEESTVAVRLPGPPPQSDLETTPENAGVRQVSAADNNFHIQQIYMKGKLNETHTKVRIEKTLST